MAYTQLNLTQRSLLLYSLYAFHSLKSDTKIICCYHTAMAYTHLNLTQRSLLLSYSYGLHSLKSDTKIICCYHTAMAYTHLNLTQDHCCNHTSMPYTHLNLTQRSLLLSYVYDLHSLNSDTKIIAVIIQLCLSLT